MLITSMIVSTILLGVLKYIYPSDFPAYLVVVPVFCIGVYSGLLKVIALFFELASKIDNNHQTTPKTKSEFNNFNFRFQNLERSEDGKVIDINPILKQRKKPHLRLVKNEPEGDNIA